VTVPSTSDAEALITTVAGAVNVAPLAGDVMEHVGGWLPVALKFATMFRSQLTVSLTGFDVLELAPDHPVNSLPTSGWASTYTLVPEKYRPPDGSTKLTIRGPL